MRERDRVCIYRFECVDATVLCILFSEGHVVTEIELEFSFQ